MLKTIKRQRQPIVRRNETVKISCYVYNYFRIVLPILTSPRSDYFIHSLQLTKQLV